LPSATLPWPVELSLEPRNESEMLPSEAEPALDADDPALDAGPATLSAKLALAAVSNASAKVARGIDFIRWLQAGRCDRA
jgi:hypothetical protein